MKSRKLAAALALAAVLCAPAALAAEDGATKPARLVFLPLHVADADRKLAPGLEAAFGEALTPRYEVYAGARVAKVASAAAKHTPHRGRASRRQKQREALRGEREVAAAFGAHLVARADAVREGQDYLISLLIQDVWSGRAVYSRSLACQHCDADAAAQRIREMLAVPIAAEVDGAEPAAGIDAASAPEAASAVAASPVAAAPSSAPQPAALPLPAGGGQGLGGMDAQADYVLTVNQPIAQAPQYRCHTLDITGGDAGALSARVACVHLRLNLEGDAHVQLEGETQQAYVARIAGQARADLGKMPVDVLRVHAVEDTGAGYFAIGQQAQVDAVSGHGVLYVRAARKGAAPVVHIGRLAGEVHGCGVKIEADAVQGAGRVVEDCAW